MNLAAAPQIGALGVVAAFLFGLGVGLVFRVGRTRLAGGPPDDGDSARHPEHHDARNPDERRSWLDQVIVRAPVVNDRHVGVVNLRSWAQQYHPLREGVWTRLVKTFYATAAKDPEVAGYFADVDLVVLQRHFVQVLVTLTQQGLTMRTVKRLTESHQHVVDQQGRPITEGVFNKVTHALEVALRSEGVPEDTIDQVVEMLVVIKSAMVPR